MYYTWITDNIAIGELNARYDEFDIIVNLAYINESINHGLEHHAIRELVRSDNKYVIEIGLWDSDIDNLYMGLSLDIVIKKLMELKNEKNKILFHCQSGKSRSVSFALAYLCLTKHLNIEDGLEIIKQKRPIIKPRPLFLQKVSEFISNNIK